MAIRDLREYLARLQELGEVQLIDKEVDPRLEAGAVIRRAYDLRAPAPFFQKLQGHPPGFRILGAPVAMSRQAGRPYARLASAFGLPPEASYFDIQDAIVARLRAMRASPIKPVVVSREEAPCKENTMRGEEVDLSLFPAPHIHGGDGGRFMGTWHTVITRDPDTGWTNWGMYRVSVVDRDKLVVLMHRYAHFGQHFYLKYEPRGKPMPFAIAFGTEPITVMISGSPLAQAQEDEVNYVCGLRGEPVELVPAETSDLLVPAHAEIVVEGEVLPGERTMEGPFGEFPGYQISEPEPMPIFRVKAITYRQDPILPVNCEGQHSDAHAFSPILRTAMMHDFLRSQGFPISRVYSPPEGVNFFFVIATRAPYEGYTQQLAQAVFSHRLGRVVTFLMIVEDDIDISDLGELLWALATRCHPGRSINIVPNAVGIPLMPFLSADERKRALGAKVWFDCTWPKDWDPKDIPIRTTLEAGWPKEIQQQVLSRWGEYGYQD